jgi:hypothetical protein
MDMRRDKERSNIKCMAYPPPFIGRLVFRELHMEIII